MLRLPKEFWVREHQLRERLVRLLDELYDVSDAPFARLPPASAEEVGRQVEALRMLQRNTALNARVESNSEPEDLPGIAFLDDVELLFALTEVDCHDGFRVALFWDAGDLSLSGEFGELLE